MILHLQRVDGVISNQRPIHHALLSEARTGPALREGVPMVSAFHLIDLCHRQGLRPLRSIEFDILFSDPHQLRILCVLGSFYTNEYVTYPKGVEKAKPHRNILRWFEMDSDYAFTFQHIHPPSVASAHPQLIAFRAHHLTYHALTRAVLPSDSFDASSDMHVAHIPFQGAFGSPDSWGFPSSSAVASGPGIDRRSCRLLEQHEFEHRRATGYHGLGVRYADPVARIRQCIFACSSWSNRSHLLVVEDSL